jgi:hypothetical protein
MRSIILCVVFSPDEWQVAVLNSGRLQKALAQTLADGQMNAKEMADKLANTTPTHELEQQAQELQFQVSVTAAAGRVFWPSFR